VTPWNTAAPSSPGVRSGLAAREVEEEEPDGDDGGAEQAGDDAFAQHRALGWRHGRRNCITCV